MQPTKYSAEFKSEAVKQVIDKGHAVVDVAKRLGIPDGVLYKALQAEMVMLKAELRRTSVERDILKKA